MTKDGTRFGIFANVANTKDLKAANENGAEGIGLFRTEFVYMDRNNEPNESEQFEIYKKMVEGMNGKPVVIRTLDVGGDKELHYLGIPKEDNPFLGFRAVRYCLTNVPLFKTQLRALLRASVYGDLQIMVPMIANLEEIIATKKIVAEVEADLKESGVEVAAYKLGIMIEVPSAAFFSDVLAEHVDFFSIGTNDLIQYTMAADRMNKAVSYLYSPYMPAFVRLVNTVIKNGSAKNIHVAMCGELASNPRFIPLLVGMGLHEFSMSANRIVESRYIMSKLDVEECKVLRDEVLGMVTEEEIKNRLDKFYQDNLYEV
jgi:phosphotransferase system enzyme I (PtsI)